jgi:hypothetical protein
MALAHMAGTTVRMLRRTSCREPNMPTQTPASQLHHITPDLRQWSFDMWPDQSHRKSLAKKKKATLRGGPFQIDIAQIRR